MNRPMIESLESRALFAATLPDLSAAVTYTPPATLQPGSSIAPSLIITNTGAAMSKETQVPVRLYISPTRKLAARSSPFKVFQEHLNLAASGSTTISLSSILPTKIDYDRYYIIVQLNNRRALKESSYSNNYFSTSSILNPAGRFAGHFHSDDGRSGSASLNIIPTAASTSSSSTTPAALYSDFTATTDGIRIHLSHLKTTVSAAGALTLTATGHYKDHAHGNVHYKLTISATLTDKTLAGTFNLRLQSATLNRNSNSTFTVTRP